MVASQKIDFTTFLLGLVKITTNQSGITSETTVTGSSMTIIVPSISTKIELTVNIPLISATVAGDRVLLQIKEASTSLHTFTHVQPTNLGSGIITSTVISGLSAGSHTLTLTLTRDVGSGSLATNSNATYPLVFYAKIVG